MTRPSAPDVDPASGTDGEAQLPAGRVGRAHGLDGSFYVTGARPRLLAMGAKVKIAGETLEIVRRAGSDARPIVRVQGIEDRVAAEAVRGQSLTVTGAEAPALGEGEWWAHELEGCRVVDGTRHVGLVARLIELPSCEALEVTREPRSGYRGPRSGHREPRSADLLVPMVKDAIRSVDVDAGVIDVNMEFVEE